MFDAVRKNQRISQIILAIIIVPFAFFGLDAYFTDTPGAAEVAKVGGAPITMFEFDQAIREQQDRVRQASGSPVDQAVFESEGFRRSVLENLINQRLLSMHAADGRLTVTAQQMQQVIGTLPSFQDNGQFSLARYESLLRAQGMSPAMFENRLAQDLKVQQVAQAIGDAAIVGQASAKRFLEAQLEEREVRHIVLSASAVDAQIDDAAVKAHYDANAARFERPARMKAEYVVFDQDALLQSAGVDEAAVRAFYDANLERFGKGEERRARHILLQLAADATPEQAAAAQDKAKSLLEQLRADPAKFEALARSESQDPGSAANGGDLGFFGRGMMVQAFEDAAFALQTGEISDVVRSDFGLHIIRLEEIKASEPTPFEAVRADILAELGRQQAARDFAAKAELFANTVYEQADSLAPVAEALGLEVKTSDWISRETGDLGGLRNDRLVSALFSDDVLKNAHNTEAIEVERGKLVAARMKEYEPAQRMPLDAVKEEIRARLKVEAAARAMREQGEALLAKLNAGEESGQPWSEAALVGRADQAHPATALQAIFTASTAKLPVHVGAADPSGDYRIYRILSVKRPELGADDPRVEAVMREYQRLVGQREFAAFLEALRVRYPVEIRAAALRVEARQ